MIGARRLSTAFAMLIVGGGALLTVGYFYLRGSIQPRSGTEAVVGIDEPVEISFDEWAIPTIVAGSERDLLWAQGFLHASERLWQLDLFQRIARGRLSEIFGAPALSTDRLIRTLDLWGAAEEALAVLPPDDLKLLEAYAQGVNAKINSWAPRLPPEFMLLGIEPQPWSPQASLAIAKIMSLDLSGWQSELRRMATLSRLPPDYRATLELGYPDWGPTILQDTEDTELRPVQPPSTSSAERAPSPDSASPGPFGGVASDAPGGFASRVGSARGEPSWDPVETLSAFGFRASNSWALGGTRTADGAPLLANDMHLSLRAPSTWYINALHADSEGVHVVGFSIPGAPGVVVGLNRNVAWGFTNAMLDGGDFIVESVNLDASMYRFEDDWRPFETRTESIEVRGRDEPVEHVVRLTERGPVITDVLPSGGLTLSLLWTGFAPLAPASALFRMNRAASGEDFREAVGAFRGPHQNVIFITRDGELGYRMAGAIPDRGGEDGTAPISFERLPHGWIGLMPADSNPAGGHPESDFLASANNLQSHAHFGIVGADYPMPFRARRIVDQLRDAEGWTVADMVDLQLDTRSLWADRLLPRAVAAAERVGEAGVAERLAAWDREVDLESAEAVVFHSWLYRLRALIAADELEGDGWFSDLAFDRILSESPVSGEGENRWIDDTRTPEVERLTDLEDQALITAVEAAGDAAWGDVHFERSVHPLGEVLWIDRLFRFQVGPYPAPGGRHTVRPDDPGLWGALDSTSWEPPFIGAYGPSERFVAHMDPGGPTGHFFLPTGQSGNPLDRHYRDMSRTWIEGAMAAVSLDPALQMARESSRLRLAPVSDRRSP